MKRTTEVFLSTGLSLGLILSGSACGEDNGNSDQDKYEAEVDRIAGEFEIAKSSLTNGQKLYEAELESLPDDCRKVVMPYLPPEGSLMESSIDVAIHETAQWCAPDSFDAVAVLRGMYETIESMQSQVNTLEFDLGANLAAAGVTIPK